VTSDRLHDRKVLVGAKTCSLIILVCFSLSRDVAWSLRITDNIFTEQPVSLLCEICISG
jgi:hypothetical protein